MIDHVAYIDAASGSYVLAAIASGGAGVWFFVRSNLAKLKKKNRKGYSDPELVDGGDETPAEIDVTDGEVASPGGPVEAKASE